MTFNKLAIYGHRGWASSAISQALIDSGAPVTVLYRPGSDVSTLPSTVQTIEVDVEDEEALVRSLQGIDIVISLVGQEGVQRQFEFIKAIPKTNVKLFVPSDLSYKADQNILKIPALRIKDEVEQAAKDAGVPVTVIRPGNFVESTLASGLVGVDAQGNRIIYTGDSENQKLNLCSRNYVASAYASIFAKTPVDEIKNRAIGLSELIVTGSDIFQALHRKHNSPPKVFRQSLDQVDEEVSTRLSKGDRVAIVFVYRRPWGSGTQIDLVGNDIWEVEGYKKATLDELLVEGKMEPYKDFPPQFTEAISATFF